MMLLVMLLDKLAYEEAAVALELGKDLHLMPPEPFILYNLLFF